MPSQTDLDDDPILKLVALHPWIDATQAAALAGCSRRWAGQQLAGLVSDGLAQSCRVAGLCTPGALYALTTRGGAALPLPDYVTPGFVAQALLQIEALWGARNLLTLLARSGQLLSAASPVKIRCADARGRPLSLNLQAHATAAGGDRRIPFVVRWDLGEVDTAAFDDLFAGLYRWSLSDAYRGQTERFPVTVLVTINPGRVWQLLEGWQRTADHHHTRLLPCYVGVWLDVATARRPDVWFCAGNGTLQTRLFGGPSRPAGNVDAMSTLPAAAGRRVDMDVTDPAQATPLLRAHLAVPEREARRMLRYVAAWPLLAGDELALLVNRHPRSVWAALKALRELDLITAYPIDARREGYYPSPLGIELLAAACGLTPLRYARARHWPVTGMDGHLRYSLLTMTNSPQHTRDVRAFFVSLARLAGRCRRELALDHALVVWDEVDSHRHFRHGGRQRALAPDSGGVYRIGHELYTFFLEVDRGTESPARLRRKFDGYYAYRASGLFRRDAAILAGAGLARFPQVLVIAPDEGRAGVLRRVILDVARLYGGDPLPAWVAIQETLDRYGPGAPVWREVVRWRFEHCFEGFRSPPESARMGLDLRELRRKR